MGQWCDSKELNHVWNRMGSDPIQSHEYVIFLFLFVRPNLLSRLGYKYIQGIMNIGLASLIEGHWSTEIILLFVVRFNPSFFYALLYVDPRYGDIFIITYLGYQIKAYVQLLINICFLIKHK